MGSVMNEPDRGEDMFRTCLQQAVLVTLFSLTDFLTWEGRHHLGIFPTQASAVMTQTTVFFLKLSALQAGHCTKAYISGH